MSSSRSKSKKASSNKSDYDNSSRDNICIKLVNAVKNTINKLTTKEITYPRYEKYVRNLREMEQRLSNLECPMVDFKTKPKSFVKETYKNISGDCKKILENKRNKTLRHCIWYKFISQLGIFLQGWVIYYSKNPHQFNTRASIPFHNIIAFTGAVNRPDKIIDITERVMRKQGRNIVDKFVSKPIKMILQIFKRKVNMKNQEMTEEEATNLLELINSDPSVQSAFPDTNFHLNLSYCRITHDTEGTCNEDVECTWVKTKKLGYCRRSNTRGVKGSKSVFRDIRARRSSPTHTYKLRKIPARVKSLASKTTSIKKPTVRRRKPTKRSTTKSKTSRRFQSKAKSTTKSKTSRRSQSKATLNTTTKASN